MWHDIFQAYADAISVATMQQRPVRESQARPSRSSGLEHDPRAQREISKSVGQEGR